MPDDPAMPSDGPEETICSARGCQAIAVYDLQWNNPKIHTSDRRKHWVACNDHRDSLSEFLSARGFLREVLPLAS
ncbi:MAG: hypothetical protein QOF52_189 [Propionibacteriaceae bacterium]|nr:hypothetical protein [Propionibacteriaceae bacterium]MDX6320331.1 hypothetical protein [Propionibacteriaceae bacterium]